ncbi:hypothetical protein ACCD06_00530 [Azospirillum sp. CT11-132]|jgi:hypothetical protein|uniref:hypothetical protein n=1 Tax=unclassified Azospirillum TaxID=2630922 RepID=UPI000D621B0E|nr:MULTISPECIES: hypothetical protein [unclassified Azospirillum]PWC60001.1 hypothetical protein TSH7_19485 [Azospirillum sp. TSH7]PWC71116.1 hypothetical protein TSH20_04240 [Azospirillum sp. TSH20]QCG94019.1 hypothetical protein E6C67_08720 [Azospirillum sp. TSA2s]
MTGTDTARPRLLPVLPGVTCLFAALSAMALLSGCSSPPSYREWTASPEVPTVAYDECTEQVDNTMRLRGYPLRPLPETPQFGYRREMFALCMRRKGYTAE